MRPFKSTHVSATLLSLALLLMLRQTLAAEAIIIGGGSDVSSSPEQLEQDVKWVQDVLNDQLIPTTTYFTDGDTTGADVHYRLPDANKQDSLSASSMEPIARIFGDNHLERQRYREHNINDVIGSTRWQDLEPAINDLLARSKHHEETLLIFNGLGRLSGTRPESATMDLWDNSSLSVKQLHQTINQRTSPVRFVFNQCHSGGFHRLAYKNPEKGLTLSGVRHCGFTSESVYRHSENCSVDTNLIGNAEYSSHFFSALHGYEPDGQIISRFPDTNKDGQVSLREAHLFTLQEAFSSQVPRSTSEDFLIRWQPWYLRWMPNSKLLPNNEYARLFRDVAASYKIDLDNGVANTLRSLLANHTSEISLLEKQLADNRLAVAQLQSRMQQNLSAKWPKMLSPYTSEYNAFIESGEFEKVSTYIRNSMSEYQQLVLLQDQIIEQEKQRNRLLRQTAVCRKLLHLRQLAYLKKQLTEYGSSEDKASYESLMQCESEPLTPPSILTTDITQ